MTERYSAWALALALFVGTSLAGAEESAPPGDEPAVADDRQGEGPSAEAPDEGSAPTPEGAPEAAAPPESPAPEGAPEAAAPPESPAPEGAPEAAEPEATPAMPRVESPPSPEQVLPPERLRAPLVRYETAWAQGVGFLIGDQRTVVVLGNLRDRHRRITCRMANDAEGPQVRVARVEVSTQEEPAFVILHLERDLPGTPLRISPASPEVGDSVYLILRRHGPRHGPGGRRGLSRRSPRSRGNDVPEALEPAEATVTTASATTLTVGTAYPQIWNGSPLFDRRGRVLGFFGAEGYAVRVEHILAPASRRSGRQRLQPIFGARIGTEFEGSLDDPIVFDIEAGLSLWDQMAILLRLGVGVGNDVLLRLPPNAAHETGIVEAQQRTIALSLEVKYRLLLTRAPMPFYLDVAMGLQYNVFVSDPTGVALYSTEPSCDPFGQGCDLTVGVTPGRRTTQGVGPVFGLDVRAGIFTMGYRFVAEALSYELPNTHRLTFGLTFR